MLSQQQVEAIGLLTTTPLTQGEIAEKVGVSESSIYRWLTHNEEFQSALRGIRDAQLARIAAQLPCDLSVSLKRLRKETDDASQAKDRIAAADKLLHGVMEATAFIKDLQCVERLENAESIDTSAGKNAEETDGTSPPFE